MMRLLTAKRMTLGLVVLGSLALASGCGAESTPTTAPEDAQARVNAMTDAMAKQNAPGGPAHSKTPRK
jgi:hypothetical protein